MPLHKKNAFQIRSLVPFDDSGFVVTSASLDDGLGRSRFGLGGDDTLSTILIDRFEFCVSQSLHCSGPGSKVMRF